MKFQHFLITKVNLGYIERVKPKGIDPEMWLEKRLMLFNKYCIPSIHVQSNNNFNWLIYLDDRTPQIYRDLLIISLKGLNNVKLFYKKGDFYSLSNHVISDIKSLISNRITHLITSRVDTDDMLHRNYILKIQKLFTGQDYQPINFDLGFFYHDSKGIVGTTRHKCNPFLTLIEKVNNKEDHAFKTVLYKNHMEFCIDNKKLSIKGKPNMWCMSIHDINDSTDFYARPYLLKNIDLSKDFNFQFQNKPKINDRITFFSNYCKREYNKYYLLLLRRLNLNNR